MPLPRYTGAHRPKVNVTRRRHARSNRLLIFTVTLILAAILVLGVLYATRHGTSTWMSPSP
jgi:hypothetical protein